MRTARVTKLWRAMGLAVVAGLVVGGSLTACKGDKPPRKTVTTKDAVASKAPATADKPTADKPAADKPTADKPAVDGSKAPGPDKVKLAGIDTSNLKPRVIDTNAKTADELRDEAVLARQARRTYAGAPPVIPHKYDPNCLSCHRQPTSNGKVWSPEISHPHYQNCQQCHVLSESEELGQIEGGPPELANSFEGLRWGPGERTLPGSPPTIPHPTGFRDNCLACHGTTDHEGLRSSHVKRTNCRQCHVSSASLEQLAVMPWAGFPAVQHP